MNRVWLDAPWPALHLRRPDRAVQPNAAALAWARAAGLPAQALHDWPGPAEGDTAPCAVSFGPVQVACVAVPLEDGLLLWLQTEAPAEPLPDGQARHQPSLAEQTRLLHLEKLRLEQLSGEKSAFMARVSQELRTPMNALLGFTQLMEIDRDEPPRPRQRERLRHIARAGQQMLAQIDDLLAIAHREVEAAAAAPQAQLRVLCVEDNPVNLQLVRELLALRPAVQLRTAIDGTGGLAAAHAERPDLLLLDLQLPDIDGLEVMRQLRADPSFRACRIVALSADAMPEHISAALAAGFDDYWTKPIQFDVFLARIDRLVAEGRAVAAE
jgi:CheY-like chemotaxis protein